MRETLKKPKPNRFVDYMRWSGYADVRGASWDSLGHMSVLKNIAWNSVRWPQVKLRVRRLQNRIFKAKKSGKTKIVHNLQKKLIRSFDAKLLSVLQVTTLNKGRKTPGVDKQIITSNRLKYSLARNLRLDGKALPIRRVWIPKPGKTEKRPLGIPTIIDRAKQNLAKLALEPEWEAVFEPNSYGFRPGRSCHDAIEAIYECLHHKRVKYVYDADIRKCFDRIDHEALLNKLETFPGMKAQIKAWLKADIMEGYANNPKEVTPSAMGTPQGGIVSPLLANIALHGIENHLKRTVGDFKHKMFEKNRRGVLARKKSIGVIRYADDFVLIHEHKMTLELCVKETVKWLANMGLELSEEKSKLRDGRHGFKFLGHQIILVRRYPRGPYKVKIKPHKDNMKNLCAEVKKVIKYSKAVSAYDLISKLRPKIIGWANYFRYCECSSTFKTITNRIFKKIRTWVFRHDNRNGRLKVKQKYFPLKEHMYQGKIHEDNWILYGEKLSKKGKKIKTFLPQMSWVEKLKHVKIKGTASPFDGNQVYWATRMSKHSTLPSGLIKLLKSQKFICPYCNTTFRGDDVIEKDHIVPKSLGGSDSYENLQALHKICHIRKTKQDFSSIGDEVDDDQ